MLHILRQIETISACRDRDLLAASIVAGIKESFRAVRVASLLRLDGESAFALVARADESGLQVVTADSTGEVLLVTLPDALGAQVREGRAGCVGQDHPGSVRSPSTRRRRRHTGCSSSRWTTRWPPKNTRPWSALPASTPTTSACSTTARKTR